jgi:hypothetical protein
MCLYPKLIQNRRYVPNRKNGGVPPVCPDNRLRQVTAACGRCYECRKQKANAWLVRMEEEWRANPHAIFVTLTIDDENFSKLKEAAESEDVHKISKIAVRRFLERIRKKTGKSITHWFINELGHENSKRLHLHGVIWGNEIQMKQLVNDHWNYGFVFIGQYVGEKTIRYITKYMTKDDEDNKDFHGKVFCSAGIGKGYCNRIAAKENVFKEEKTNENYRLRNGAKVNLPVYYRNQLYTEEQREKLFLHKIIKGDVWVNGIKVNMHKNPELYLQILAQEQKHCRILHGDRPQEWRKEKYERQIAAQREWRRKEKRRIFLQTQIIEDFAPF